MSAPTCWPAAHALGFTLPACRYPPNPMTYIGPLRALLLAMIDWTLDKQAPPLSRWPSLAKGELVPAASLRGPAGIGWARVVNEPIPPQGRPAWPILVPQIDADGNDLPGIRPPQLAAPVGTLLGWNLRKAGYGEGDLCLLAEDADAAVKNPEGYATRRSSKIRPIDWRCEDLELSAFLHTDVLHMIRSGPAPPAPPGMTPAYRGLLLPTEPHGI